MKKQMCQFQETVFDVKRKIHVSRCENEQSKSYLAAISEGVCQKCPLIKSLSAIEQQNRINRLPEISKEEIGRRVDKEIFEKRYQICWTCEQLDSDTLKCQACKCKQGLPIDVWLWFPAERCPAELWD